MHRMPSVGTALHLPCVPVSAQAVPIAHWMLWALGVQTWPAPSSEGSHGFCVVEISVHCAGCEVREDAVPLYKAKAVLGRTWGHTLLKPEPLPNWGHLRAVSSSACAQNEKTSAGWRSWKSQWTAELMLHCSWRSFSDLNLMAQVALWALYFCGCYI